MIAPNKSDLTLNEFFQTHYLPSRHMNANGISAEQLAIAIRRFGVFIGHDSRLSDLTEDNVVRFMAAGLAQAKPLSPVTINSRCRLLKTLWRFAVRKRFILVDDDNNLEAVDWIPVERTNPRAWTIEEMESIVKSARLARGRFLGVLAAKWWPAFLLVLYDTGLRFTAAMGCRFDEVDWTNKMLCVPPGRQKNRVEQFFRLHDQTIEALLETLPPKRQLLFPWPFPTQRTIYYRFKVILKRAGLPFTRRDLFHRIRRTTATHVSRLIGEQAAIRQLGHQNQSTIKRYIDPRFTAEHHAAEHLPRLAWESPKALEVQAVAGTPTPEPLPPVSLRYSREQLRGEGVDIFERLHAQDTIDGADLRAAIEALGIGYQEFAKQAKIDHRHLGKMMAGKLPIGAGSDKLIRKALGLTYNRDGEGRRLKGGA